MVSSFGKASVCAVVMALCFPSVSALAGDGSDRGGSAASGKGRTNSGDDQAKGKYKPDPCRVSKARLQVANDIITPVPPEVPYAPADPADPRYAKAMENYAKAKEQYDKEMVKYRSETPDQVVPKMARYLWIRDHLQFGSDGIATLIRKTGESIGTNAGGKSPSDADSGGGSSSGGKSSSGSPIDDASGGGFSFGASQNSIGGPQINTLKGAIGLNICVNQATDSVVVPYVRLDDESSDTFSGGVKSVSRTTRQFEYGLVFRQRIGTDYLYFQPFVLQDQLRHSHMEVLNFRYVPLRACPDGGCAVFGTHIKTNLNQYGTDEGKSYSTKSMLMLDFRLEDAHFSEPGTPLAQTPGGGGGGGHSGGNTVSSTYLNNEDFVRLGGRIGLGVKYVPSWFPALNNETNDSGMQTKPIDFKVYYVDFYPITGIRHRSLGEAVATVDIPVAQSVDLTFNYQNGRSDFVAQREVKWSVGLNLK